MGEWNRWPAVGGNAVGEAWVPHHGWPTLQTHGSDDFIFWFFLMGFAPVDLIFLFFFQMDLALDLVFWFFLMTLATFRVIKSQNGLKFPLGF